MKIKRELRENLKTKLMFMEKDYMATKNNIGDYSIAGTTIGEINVI